MYYKIRNISIHVFSLRLEEILQLILIVQVLFLFSDNQCSNIFSSTAGKYLNNLSLFDFENITMTNLKNASVFHVLFWQPLHSKTLNHE